MKASREPVIEMNIGGLKCDAPGCNWRDDTIPVELYPALINCACPDCGANILTEADYRAVYLMMRVTNWCNRWLWWLPRTGKPKTYSANLSGDGKPRWTVEDGGGAEGGPENPKPFREAK